jgi:nucleoside-diphosphate-sugar epimerase
MKTLKILILGINGFIGNSLAARILDNTDWELHGLDLATNKLDKYLHHPRLQFHKGNLTSSHDWLSEKIQHCDIVFPLVAIANPAIYVDDPLRVFELDFEANLAVVRLCVKYQKRVIFPSTSEVYGMCPDKEFDEETSPLVLGPINKPRWIYSCSKQMLDRVIAAYGQRNELQYTLFRPFNWIGPKLDDVKNPNPKSSRALIQFIGNILRGKDITLVNGGKQRRSFTYIEDGIDALMTIIENKNKCAEQRIFNIGNPKNDISIRELAELLIQQIKTYPEFSALAEKTRLISVDAAEHFGQGYQDVEARVPSIKHAKEYLEWEPRTDLPTAIKHILDYHLVR